MPGYSATPLAQKLGIKEGSTVLVVGAPMEYLSLFESLPAGVLFGGRLTDATDIVHVFATKKEELRALLKKYRGKLRSTGTVWVSWPKKTAKVATDITDEAVREVALPLGFVDIKVCAVDNIWSGLKLVIRKELR